MVGVVECSIASVVRCGVVGRAVAALAVVETVAGVVAVAVGAAVEILHGRNVRKLFS